LFDFVSKPTCIRNWNGDPGIGLAFEICDERIKCLRIFRAKFFYGLQTNFRKFETHRRTKANKVNLGFTGFSRRSNNRCIRRETSLEWKLSLEITPLLQYPIAERGKTITQCLQQNCIRQQMLDDSANVGWLSKCWMTQRFTEDATWNPASDTSFQPVRRCAPMRMRKACGADDTRCERVRMRKPGCVVPNDFK